MAQNTTTSTVQGAAAPSATTAVPTPPPASLAATATPSVQAETYQVVVKAPEGTGMLAYLVGPGAQIVMNGIDINHATLTEEAGNLRIHLQSGGEILLLDFAASAHDPKTTIVTSEGTLPAQQLLVAVENSEQVAQANAQVEPAAGPQVANGDGHGGITPPQILGTGVGEGAAVFSSVIDPYAIPISTDAISTQDFPFQPGAGPVQLIPSGNLPPFAHNDTFSTYINHALTITPPQLLANDTDPEGDTLTVISVQGAAHGTVTMNGGNVLFTPDTDFTGTASFSYTITDGNGGTSTADVLIQIDPTFPGQNTVIAADDAYTIYNPGSSKVLNVLSNDSDPQGDALVPGSVRIISGPGVGTAVANADGTITYTSVPSNTDYFTTLVYEVHDARGAADTATVTIEVKAGNSVDAIDDTGSLVPAGAAKVFNVTNNDFDPQGDAFHITAITAGPAQGTATFDAATGTITYYSVPSAVAYTETITYQITDDRGATDTATLTINVSPATGTNSVIAADDTADLLAGQDVRIEVLNNDSDPQGDKFTITSHTDPVDENGNARGSVTVNADGTITYTDTPGANNAGQVHFTYEITDANGATDTAVVRVTIGTGINGVDANNDTLTVAANSGAHDITSTLLANDFDPQGDSFSITAVGPITTGQGMVSLAGGHVTYTTANGYDGPVTFTYTITDSKGAMDTAEVTINVQEAPSTSLNAGDDTFSTPFNTNLTITPAQLLSNDYDPQGTTISIIGHTDPSHGTLTVDGSGNYIYNPDDTFRGTDTFTYTIQDQNGDTDTAVVTIRVADPNSVDNPVDAEDDSATLAVRQSYTINVLSNDSAPDGGLAFDHVVGTLPAGVVDNGNGSFTYTAGPNDAGKVITFDYVARDIDGDTDTATVTFTVTGPNNSVDAVDDSTTTRENTPVTINVLANDTDPEGDSFSITAHTNPAHGTVVDNHDGTFTYTPATGYYGSDSFTYTITDALGAHDTATVTIGVQQNTVDAVDDATTTRENQPVTINVLSNDTDPQGDTFSVTAHTNPAHGTVVDNGNGTFTYTPEHDYVGNDSFTYTITDSMGAQDTATVTIGVQLNNVDAVDDSATTGQDKPVTINVINNDVDPQGDSFSVTAHTNPAHGTVVDNHDGTFTYTPTTGFSGNDSFTYTITDALGAQDTATVTVAVAPNTVDAQDDYTSVLRGSAVSINVLANDSDPQGDTFSIVGHSNPAYGTVAQVGNSFVYTSYFGGGNSDSFTYTIRDSRGATDTATVHINVLSPPPPPPPPPPFVNTGDGDGGGGDGCPLVIDLDNDGVTLVPLAQSNAHFNLNADVTGDTIAEHTAWYGAREGILAMDYNGNGTIDDVNEVYGGTNLDGYTELRMLEDTNHDGVFDANDANFSKLLVWTDTNQDGISQASELHTAESLGIQSIDLNNQAVSIQYQDAYISNTSTVHMADGSTLNSASVFFTNHGDGAIHGTSGNDVMVYSTATDSIDGGQGFDTMKLLTAADIIVGHDVTLKGTEAIDMVNNAADHLTLNVNDVLNISDTGVLAVRGDAVDQVTLTGDFHQEANVQQGGASYANYVGGNGAQVLVELGVTVHTDATHHG
ncbi:MAG: tandem-95 repeat protein [Proteobacteria bacterium]|nr:tandem-95 repeat protein [Pseudomonadota bacterium]